ncbi:hypothetical protein OEZ85_009000 [Tetradesmus obliquus]|uniref:RING-type domain-containing protein n=1 Tax=Tetradesmus obliquus TaxID=3088 RepID=A0ABY8TMI9_TETOB|nr:hypothetical protein OEZ85_009000 [Tetradesmus obliquus]
MSDHEEMDCPLCMDPLDATDQAINFCQCGYKMCLWCWNQLMETASREALPGRCPNCRTEYDKEKITMAQLDPDVVQKEQQRRKEQQSKKRSVADGHHRPPRALGQVRVVQRNLVYAVGMPLSICREDVLADRHYFGQFGRIKKVSVNRSTPFSQVQKSGPSGSAYVTYYRPEDALRCIEAVDGSVWEGKSIKACFGTTKYCNAFLKGVPCNNSDCLYLHDIAEAGDSFSKEDMMANGVVSGRSTFFDMVHPTCTKEATAHAHAVLSSMGSGGSSSGGGAGPSAGGGGGSAAAGACASGRPATQPMAITGARRSSSSTPWAAAAGDSGAVASPSRPGAAAMMAAAGRWGSAPKATPPAALPLNSPLADVEWPSLGDAIPDAPKHALDGQPGVAAAAGPGHASAAADAAAASPLPQQPPQQSLFGGAAAGGLSPLLGFRTHTPPQQQLFGPPGAAPPGAASSSGGFDINAFFEGPYVGAGSVGSAAAGAGSLFGGSLMGTSPMAHSPMASATPTASGLGGAARGSSDGAALSSRKQSRWGFAQQPQQQQQQSTPLAGPAGVPAPVTPGLQQQPGMRTPPGFAEPAPATPGAPMASGFGGFGGGGGGAFAGQQHAASFFKSLLPGVNVHVAASPPTPPGIGMAPPVVGVAGVAPFPMSGPPAAAPNPGLALLQQLQRGQQQQLHHQHH